MAANRAHGKEVLHWCDDCGTLILGRACDRCRSPGREFEVNSPGDIRPGMEGTRVLLMEIFQEKFGTCHPFQDRMFFLNKVAGEDRTDEVVVAGTVIGVLRFDLTTRSHAFDIRLPGALLMKDFAHKNIISINATGHLKGKSLSGDKVVDAVGPFKAGDPVLVRSGSKWGAGVALCDHDSITPESKVVRVRDLASAGAVPVLPVSDRDVFVDANLRWWKELENNAVSDIRSFLRRNNRPLSVSFSGGKDSLAALGVTMRASKDFELIFIDTGLEFPETVEYVKRFASQHNMVLNIADAGNAFWEQVGTFGPPAKDFRWCCKVCKLGPVTELISQRYPKGTITVEGNRMLESFARSRVGFVSRNPFVPNQTMLNPVRAWRAAEIWGYIWWRDLEYNPLYDRDFERIGCYLCASCLGSEWDHTRTVHPDLHQEWEDHLHGWAEEKGLPAQYVDHGFWRWKVLPPKMIRLAEDLDLRTEPSREGELSLKMLKGASPCAAGGYSMEAVLNLPRQRDFSYAEDALRTLGKVQYSPEFEIALLRHPKGTARLFGGGQISVTSGNARDAEVLFESVVKALLRSQMCTECGICVKSCPQRCVRIEGGMRTDDRCNACGRCISSCMVTHYYDKLGI
ncbi:MAG: phosphoadenosine phosphosulfate reductase family protein [Candidatus Methanomethylophilaceae archaeon]